MQLLAKNVSKDPAIQVTVPNHAYSESAPPSTNRYLLVEEPSDQLMPFVGGWMIKSGPRQKNRHKRRQIADPRTAPPTAVQADDNFAQQKQNVKGWFHNIVSGTVLTFTELFRCSPVSSGVVTAVAMQHS
eukprot:COSAG02_NODE_3994_length_5940_cov_6.413457_3_plen_130_part_00